LCFIRVFYFSFLWHWSLKSGPCLVRKCSTTWAMPPFAYAFSYLSFGSCLYGPAWTVFFLFTAGMTGLLHTPSFYWLRWSLVNFLYGLPQATDVLISTSWVARITDMTYCVQCLSVFYSTVKDLPQVISMSRYLNTKTCVNERKSEFYRPRCTNQVNLKMKTSGSYVNIIEFSMFA
jgi:hypothetical protein